MIGDDRRPARLDRIEQVAVRHQAQALVPGIVAWRIVGHVDIRPHFLAHHLEQPALEFCRLLARQVEHEQAEQHILPAGQQIGELCRQETAQPQGPFVLAGPRYDIGRRTLQHRHMCRRFRHRRHQGHRGGTAADHHDLLAGIVERFRPELRMDNRSGKIRLAGEVRIMAFVIAVIARAHMEEIALHRAERAIALLQAHRPQRLFARPVGIDHLVVEPYLVVQAIFVDGFIQIVEDRWRVGNCPARGPGFEIIAQCIHVAVRADAGIFEQVPGPAESLARLDNGKAFARASLAQVDRRANAGQAGTDNQYVENVIFHAALLLTLVSVGKTGFAAAIR